MRAGVLLYPITIQALTETVNEYGERKKTWTTQVETKADILHRDGRVETKNSEIFTSYTVDFRIRIQPQVTEKMRVLYKGTPYDIEAVIPNYDLRMLTLKTVKVND